MAGRDFILRRLLKTSATVSALVLAASQTDARTILFLAAGGGGGSGLAFSGGGAYAQEGVTAAPGYGVAGGPGGSLGRGGDGGVYAAGQNGGGGAGWNGPGFQGIGPQSGQGAGRNLWGGAGVFANGGFGGGGGGGYFGGGGGGGYSGGGGGSGRIYTAAGAPISTSYGDGGGGSFASATYGSNIVFARYGNGAANTSNNDSVNGYVKLNYHTYGVTNAVGEYTVAASGFINIVAAGGQGGNGLVIGLDTGGYGGIVSENLRVWKGEKLFFDVGAAGGNGYASATDFFGGGGGGGSFVWTDTTATPEPETWRLLEVGVLGVGVALRRRFRDSRRDGAAGPTQWNNVSPRGLVRTTA